MFNNVQFAVRQGAADEWRDAMTDAVEPEITAEPGRLMAREIAEQPGRRWMWAVTGCMALGLLAKPMLVTLPCALLLLDVWPLRRTPAISWSRLLVEKAGLFLLAAASSSA